VLSVAGRVLALFVAIAACFPLAQARELRLVTVGTSLTAVGGWQAPLEQALAACKNTPVTIINLGVGSSNSRHGLERIEAVLAARPDVVLYEFSINDAYVKFEVSLPESRNNTLKFIDNVGNSARIILMTMNPTHGAVADVRPELADYYRLYRAIAAERGLGLVDNAVDWAKQNDLSTAIPDGVHPTVEAAAGIIVPNVVRLLCP